MNSPITSNNGPMPHHSQVYMQPQYVMPIKCEPTSPTYPITTANSYSQYMPVYVNSIAHSPQLPPTPPSPMTTMSHCVSSFPMPNPIVAHSLPNSNNLTSTSNSVLTSLPTQSNAHIATNVSTHSNQANCTSTVSLNEQQLSPCPVVPISPNHQQILSQITTAASKSVLPVQKPADSAGIAARMASKKQNNSSETGGKRIKSSSSGRSANSVTKRNERERKRVKNVNIGFQTLRARIPNCTKKMSKVETLRSAVDYIRQLQQVLYGEDAPLPMLDMKLETDSNNSQSTADFDFFDLDELLC